jgi:hypothetical protein
VYELPACWSAANVPMQNKQQSVVQKKRVIEFTVKQVKNVTTQAV